MHSLTQGASIILSCYHHSGGVVFAPCRASWWLPTSFMPHSAPFHSLHLLTPNSSCSIAWATPNMEHGAWSYRLHSGGMEHCILGAVMAWLGYGYRGGSGGMVDCGLTRGLPWVRQIVTRGTAWHTSCIAWFRPLVTECLHFVGFLPLL